MQQSARGLRIAGALLVGLGLVRLALGVSFAWIESLDDQDAPAMQDTFWTSGYLLTTGGGLDKLIGYSDQRPDLITFRYRAKEGSFVGVARSSDTDVRLAGIDRGLMRPDGTRTERYGSTIPPDPRTLDIWLASSDASPAGTVVLDLDAIELHPAALDLVVMNVDQSPGVGVTMMIHYDADGSWIHNLSLSNAMQPLTAIGCGAILLAVTRRQRPRTDNEV